MRVENQSTLFVLKNLISGHVLGSDYSPITLTMTRLSRWPSNSA